ncbi:MAG TPA: wax ester/triacylglycerol synthase family O-acyltransferase [Amycolatopsis sp.]|nr:wax ester/triacylglycerol synthase family O-acyltransferase [Amycolatopsis sp.]
MDRLSPLDAMFLEIEDADPNASLAIASVALVEGPAPSWEEFAAASTTLLPLLPRSRQRVRRVPLDLGPSVWVDDQHADLARHLHRISAPAPGDEAALCEVVATIMAERLDRARPLWECWVIEGLDRGRWAILSKVHHCVTDGISGTTVHEHVFRDQRPTTLPAGEPKSEPNTARLLLASVGGQVTDLIEGLNRIAGALVAPWRVPRLARDLGTLATALVPVTPSSLSGPIGRQRHYELAHASLPEIIGIGRAFGATVNDVVLAAIAGGFRAVLLDRGENPAPDTVRSVVPVSLHQPGQHAMGNQFTVMLPMLPVDLGEPVARLMAVRHRLTDLKAHAGAGLAATTFAQHAPFAPIAWAVRAAATLPQRSVVAVTTNVPGPRHRLSVLGRPIVELYPYVPIALRLRTGIAVLSYVDRVSFGISADLDTRPKRHLLAEAIERDIASLSDAARVITPSPANDPLRDAERG